MNKNYIPSVQFADKNQIIDDTEAVETSAYMLTDEEEEILKCKQDPAYFIEKYCVFNTLTGPGKVKLHDYQKI